LLVADIAGMFAAGDFKAPMLIHDQVTPGVPLFLKLEAELKYQYEDIRDGRVRIATMNKRALAAVYEFLRFQITDHLTRDH
jgi:hypothetical protein